MIFEFPRVIYMATVSNTSDFSSCRGEGGGGDGGSAVRGGRLNLLLKYTFCDLSALLAAFTSLMCALVLIVDQSK